MTAELVSGQNHPLPTTRLEIRIAAGASVIAGATLGDEEGRLRDPAWIAHPASPRLPGVEVSSQAAADHRLAVDLEALPPGARRVYVLLALPDGADGPTSFGGLPAPSCAVTALDGTEIATYTMTTLTAESAVIAVELYLRRGAWRVRAVGQGYADGLAALLHDQGLPEARRLASTVLDAVAEGRARAVAPPPPAAAARAGQPPAAQPAAAARTGTPEPATGASSQPVAGDASGWTMEERLYNQVWGMFEDLARAVAAYRSAVSFADSRREQELDRVLGDPATRVGPAADAARAAARARYTELVEAARAALDRDLAQLTAEAEVVEPALPPAYARWDSPVWQRYTVPTKTPMALRLGDLSLPECPTLRIPMLMRLPLQRGVWIDTGRGAAPAVAAALDGGELRRLGGETATAIAARLLAAHPVDTFVVHVFDPTGAATAAMAPLVRTGVLRQPPAVDAAGLASLLDTLTRRVDLVQMAVRNRATDALPPDVDPAQQLLVVHDFPHGFDDRAVTQLRYLADEGPSVGVHLMMVADRQDAQGFGPLLDPLWRSLLRLTPVPCDHLADPWVGHAWTYEPPLAPHGSPVLSTVLERVRAARRSHGGNPR